MPFTPKRTKYRKSHKMPLGKGVATKGSTLQLGEFGLQATTRGHISERQIEAGRRAINRHIKNLGRTYIRVLADKPITKKPAEVKMGKGKGAIDHWAAPIKPGRIIYEVRGVSLDIANTALLRGAAKLSVRTHIVQKAE